MKRSGVQESLARLVEISACTGMTILEFDMELTRVKAVSVVVGVILSLTLIASGKSDLVYSQFQDERVTDSTIVIDISNVGADTRYIVKFTNESVIYEYHEHYFSRERIDSVICQQNRKMDIELEENLQAIMKDCLANKEQQTDLKMSYPNMSARVNYCGRDYYLEKRNPHLVYFQLLFPDKMSDCFGYD